jgi:dipeptidyl aminopeptidase/acylaminoacyl peptidase
MMSLKQVSEPVPSPDGKWLVFAAVDVNLEANTMTSHLWVVPTGGGPARRLNQTPNHEERPRFSPDGKRLIWTSKATDPPQIWMSNFTAETGSLEGAARQITDISTGADGGIWSPDGNRIVFVSSVYADCRDDACNKQRDEELSKNKVKAKIFTKLFYRHWNAFSASKRNHLFVINSTSDFTSGERLQEGRDLTPGDHDVPPFQLGGEDLYAISPDSQEVAYTSNGDKVEATSTNTEIFVVPIGGGGMSKRMSNSPGADSVPRYSPDGKYLAWHSQARAGFESDRWRLVAQDRQSKKLQDLTENFDRSVGSFVWKRDSRDILFTGEDHGETPIWLVSVETKQSTEVAISGFHISDLTAGASETFYFTAMSISAPNEIGKISFPTKQGVELVTHMNDASLSEADLQPIKSFTFKGADNDDVKGFLMKPPGFDSEKKYPVKFLIHGGPQEAWGNSWSYRWNPQLFAANGYIVVMINFHGSTGYGQKFTDSISGDWGGKPYIDLMKGLDYVEKTYPFIDKTREAALGASYGGYMANWILGHTDRFKCIVSHDSMFNTESAYGTTEELWFPEWEFKGPPWKNRDLYRKWSPHLFADKFKTPTLVIHGQLDYRLDVSEAFQLFTTLQRLKVPSKMLYFPDEGHWVLKPQNARLWYKTVNDWVDEWCGRN